MLLSCCFEFFVVALMLLYIREALALMLLYIKNKYFGKIVIE